MSLETFVPIMACELTCPHCGHRHSETMPVDACIVSHACTGCGRVLRPNPGDCCVYCSYGSSPCPPIQIARAGGDAGKCCYE